MREALAEEGIDISADLPRSGSAKDFGDALQKHGFDVVASAEQGFGFPPPRDQKYTPQEGDVVVIQPVPGHPDGHMAMWTGARWDSDFKQERFWPHHDYDTAKPRFVIYRHRQKV